MMISFELNGRAITVDLLPHRLVSHVLREEFSLRSLRRRCSDGSCGTCLVLLNDEPVPSCILPAFELKDRSLWTAEGLSGLKGFSDILEGFRSGCSHLCEICAPARALAAEGLLRKTLRPTAGQIFETAGSVHCSCSSTDQVVGCIAAAAREREKRLHE